MIVMQGGAPLAASGRDREQKSEESRRGCQELVAAMFSCLLH